MFTPVRKREVPVDAFQALKAVNDVTVKLLTLPEAERPTQFAIAVGVRATCFHLGWAPEEMLALDDATRKGLATKQPTR
jgi:hypothetical protein